MKIKILSLFLIFIILSISSYSQTNDEESRKIKVNLVVTAVKNIEAEINSYLNRQLRSLEDVKIVDSDDNPAYILSVLSMELKTESGYKPGVVFSTVVMEPLKPRIKFLAYASAEFMIRKLFGEEEGIKNSEEVRSFFYSDDASDSWFRNLLIEDAVDLKNHWIQTGGEDDLKIICQKIIAKFDVDHLSEHRKLLEETFGQ